MPNLEIDPNDLIESLTAQRNAAQHQLALTDAALKGALRRIEGLEKQAQAHKDVEPGEQKPGEDA